jgi:hypothetical protein
VSKDNIKAVVVESVDNPDIGIVTHGSDLSVSVSRVGGLLVVNIDNLSGKRLSVDVTLSGNEPIWEGVMEP